MKLFEQVDSSLQQTLVEQTRSYSDMRYELNKLISLNHPHIVKFIGIITNPHCFLLEWAPKMSLDAQRTEHSETHTSMCPTSIFYTLMQVRVYVYQCIIVHTYTRSYGPIRYVAPAIATIDDSFSLQVTSALAYLHSPHEVGIVHRDLRSSNILVFQFPALGHQCFSHDRQTDCRVLVKVTDMGICANPLPNKAKADGGLRILAPECIGADSFKLTEKVHT